MKKIIKIMKKLTFSFLLLYTYNLIAVSYNMIIPINLFTVLFLSFLDVPGLILIVTVYKIFYLG